MKRKIPVEDLALAYELRTEGVAWKRIAIATGHDAGHLRDAMLYIIKHGFRRGE